MLSKSLYIPSSGSLGKKKSGGQIPEVADMAKELPKLDKYGLILKNELNLKYQIEKIYKEFEQFLDNINFQKASAPFITNTFHVQRKSAFKALNHIIKDLNFEEKQIHYSKFVERVDKNLLKKFQYKLKEPYVDLVFQKHYNLPKNIDMKQIKENDAYTELYNLSVIVAIWTIEIELSADLIERATAYNLYKPEDEKKDLIERLKASRENQNKFTMEGYTKKLFKSIMVKLIKKLSSFFSSKGFSFTSISWSACVGVLYYIVGQAAMPWTILLSNINIPWICGGFLASKLLDKIGEKISRSEVIADLKYLEDVIQQNTEDLMVHYQEITTAIDKCFAAETEKELEFFKDILKKKINLMLDPDQQVGGKKVSVNPSLKQSRLHLSMLIVQESDDWVICDIKDDEDSSEDIQI